jgi:hypothetical protein
MSFRYRAVIEFLVKQGNSAEVIYEWPRGVYGDVCMGASSVWRWVKHFKDENTDISDQAMFCDSEDKWSTFWEKGKVQLATFRRSSNFVVRFVKNVRRIKLSSFNMTTRGLTLHVWTCGQFKRIAGNCSPTPPPYNPDLAPSDYHLFGPLEDHLRGHYETDEAVQEVVWSWLRGAETEFTAEAFLRFCNAGGNA